VLLAATPAVAQKIGPTRTYGEDQASTTYETPKYRPAPTTPLDKNYGLPNFGMPGSELPQQRTQAPKVQPLPPPDAFANTPPSYAPKTPEPEPPDTPDFFRNAGPDFNTPLTPPAAPDNAAGNTRSAPTTYGSGTSTNYSTGPSFSTGSSTYGGGASSYSTDSSTSETPLYTTSQGIGTGDYTTTPNGAR